MTTRKFKRQAGGAFEAAETFEFFLYRNRCISLQNFKFHGRPSAIEYGRATRGEGDGRSDVGSRGKIQTDAKTFERGTSTCCARGGGRHFDSQYHPKWERGKYDNVCLPENVGEGGGLHERSVSGGVWPSASVVHQSFPFPSGCLARWLFPPSSLPLGGVTADNLEGLLAWMYVRILYPVGTLPHMSIVSCSMLSLQYCTGKREQRFRYQICMNKRLFGVFWQCPPSSSHVCFPPLTAPPRLVS